MKNEDLLEKMKKEGFFHHNHYEVVEIKQNSVILKANITEEALNPYGMAHGGFLFGLGDTAMGMLVKMSGITGVTLNSTINFLKPGRGEYIIAKGEMVKQGKKICYLKASIYDDKEQLIATMDANYYGIDK